MILEKRQINRYLRHIIIPEISGPGQKKMLQSSVSLYSENVKDAAIAIYYLAASGIGHIYCNFENKDGFDDMSFNIRDLNDDVSVELSDCEASDLRLYLGSPKFIYKTLSLQHKDFVPSIVSIFNGLSGGLQILKDEDSLKLFLSNLSECLAENEISHKLEDGIFSACLLGTLSTLEAIKNILKIGEIKYDFLYFNLYSMKFKRTDTKELTNSINEILSHQAEFKISNLNEKKALIVGTGGLGSPAAYALAIAGIGTLGLVDYDTVEISNLNRQILHSTSKVGMPKVKSASHALKSINKNININVYDTVLSKENVFDIIKEYDVIIDAVDNFPTRFLLNDACFFLRKPLIDAGVLRFDGTCMSIILEDGPCYRCLLPDIPSSESVPSCSESGVIGPIPGIFGFIESIEAIKILTKYGSTLKGSILMFDGLSSDFRIIKLKKNDLCPLCGKNPSIHELKEYKFSCSKDETALF